MHTYMITLAIALSANLKLTGWIANWNPESTKSFVAHASQLDEAMICYINVQADGTVTRRPYPEADRAAAFAAAKANHVRLYAMASNLADDFDPLRMAKVFADPELQKKHIQQLIDIAKADGFGGIDIDYESMKANDRDHFSAFMADCAKACHQNGLKLSIAVHPKTSEPGTWDGPQAHDYKAIGREVDVFRIMCYDVHWTTSEPGPIAPDAWVRQVVEFAKTLVPAEKIEVGLCCYGYDWSKKPADSLTYPDFKPRIKSDLKVDDQSGEIQTDKMWFGGFESAARKLRLSKELGVRGTAMWYIGSEQPEFWNLIKPKR